MNSSEPKLQPLCYTEPSKGAIFLLSLLAIILSPIINIIHGTYFVHKASAYHYFPHEFDYNGLIWGVFTRSLLIWWLINPFYLKKYSYLTWWQVLHASIYLFLVFTLFTFPAITGVFGGLLRAMFVSALQLLSVPEFISHFFSLFLTLVVGITTCELISLRCGHMIKNQDILYWFTKEFAVNAVIVSSSLIYLLWQQGYVA
jgi:hypothetical protein